MEYTIRKPKATDIFIVAKIIRGIGLNNIANCFKSSEVIEVYNNMLKENKGKSLTDEQLTNAGILIMTSVGDLILEKLDVVQSDLLKFISNLTGLQVKVVEDLPITDFAEIVIAIIKEPEFVDFIKVVLKSFN